MPVPHTNARNLADRLINEVELQRTILEETIESAEQGNPQESGRTICPQSGTQLPVKRFDRAVDLSECDIGATGIMHSHVTTGQLKDPKHSLPDITNVIFDDIHASMVVGTQTHDVLVKPHDREKGIEIFQDALGLEVTSTKELIQAVHDGRLSDPGDARKRVRSRLTNLFETVPSELSELDRRVTQLSQDRLIPAKEGILASCLLSEHTSPSPTGLSRQTQRMRSQRQRLAHSLSERIDTTITKTRAIRIPGTDILPSKLPL